MKRAIFLNRYFSPDHSATSQILPDLAFHVAASGMETHVVTSQQLYDDPDARLSSQETVRDVHTRFHFFCPGRIGSARILASTSSVPAVSTLCPKGASSTTSSVKPGLLGADDESLIVPVRSAEGQISSISGPSLRAIW